MRIASSFGRSPIAIPGGETRLGPNQRNALARFDQTGSMRMFRPRVWIRMLAWPIEVARKVSPETRGCGRGDGGLATASGHGARDSALRAIASGAYDFYQKPVDIDQLISLLRIWLYEK